MPPVLIHLWLTEKSFTRGVEGRCSVGCLQQHNCEMQIHRGTVNKNSSFSSWNTFSYILFFFLKPSIWHVTKTQWGAQRSSLVSFSVVWVCEEVTGPSSGRLAKSITVCITANEAFLPWRQHDVPKIHGLYLLLHGKHVQVRIFLQLRLSSNYTVRPGQLSGTRRHVVMLMIIDALRAGDSVLRCMVLWGSSAWWRGLRSLGTPQ